MPANFGGSPLNITAYRRVMFAYADGDLCGLKKCVVQLLENAIRHGVRSRKNGLVTVSTAREAKTHIITIEDNGVGFDPDRQKTPDEETHIGLENVRSRIEQMCGGTIAVNSKPGNGTGITIRIPDEARKEERRK